MLLLLCMHSAVHFADVWFLNYFCGHGMAAQGVGALRCSVKGSCMIFAYGLNACVCQVEHSAGRMAVPN